MYVCVFWNLFIISEFNYYISVFQTPEEILHHLQNIVDFGKHVMKQFFGENYVHHGVNDLFLK